MLGKQTHLVSRRCHPADNCSVPVKVDVYPGLPHAFGYFPMLSAAKKNGDDLVAGIDWLLSKAS